MHGTEQPIRNMLIDGQLTDALGEATFENVNPATEDVLGPVPDGSEIDMDRAIAAARRAWDDGTWRHDLDLRLRCLQQLRQALLEEQEQLRDELIAEVGCTRTSTFGSQLDNVLGVDGVFQWTIENAPRFAWQERLPDRTLDHRLIVREPVGVVAAITPWNVPFEIAATKLVQSLVTGNTVILKPPPETPWNALRVARLVAEETDIPPGVVNIVTSSHHERGEQLVADPRVDLISFTGSTAVGRRIMGNAADTIKRLFLELGGKSARIMLDDSDVEAVAREAARGVTHNAGQGCALLTRLLVPHELHDTMGSLVGAAMDEIVCGDPRDEQTDMGPVVSEAQYRRVRRYIGLGLEENAELVRGGGRPEGIVNGYFVEPTLFVNVDNSMQIAREEIFGPVLVIIGYRDVDDAVAIANDSPYGLSAAVSSASHERAMGVAMRLRCGTVKVNGGATYAPDVPFGGFKQSGLGRQNGEDGLRQYLEAKTIAWR